MRIAAAVAFPLQEGLTNRVGGEIVVRNGADKGRIYVFGGHIAWVVCDTISTRLRDVLIEKTNLSSDDLDAAIEETQRTKRNFGEVLVEWGMIDSDQLRAALLAHNAAHFVGILKFSEGAQAMFVPHAREYRGRLLYTLEELVQASRQLMKEASASEGGSSGASDATQPLSAQPSAASPPGTTSAQLSQSDASAVVVPAVAGVHKTALDVTLDLVGDCTAAFCLTAAGHEVQYRSDDGVPLGLTEATYEAFLDLIKGAQLPLGTGSDSPAPHAGEIVLLSEKSFCVARKLDGDRDEMFGVVCEHVRNLGLSLGMARTRLKALCNDTNTSQAQNQAT